MGGKRHTEAYRKITDLVRSDQADGLEPKDLLKMDPLFSKMSSQNLRRKLREIRAISGKFSSKGLFPFLNFN